MQYSEPQRPHYPESYEWEEEEDDTDDEFYEWIARDDWDEPAPEQRAEKRADRRTKN